MIKYRSAFFLLIVLFAAPMRAVVPGGLYNSDTSIAITFDPNQLPRTMGYHLVRGTVLYHGRSLPFCWGIFLPRLFFHTHDPLPIVMTLHNKSGIGENGDGAIIGEGLGQILAYGVQDPRADGDKPDDPTSLRRDAQFIGIVPQCPASHTWADTFMTKLLCNLIDKMVGHYHADADRVYLTGFSYGGTSCWDLSLTVPDRFAAIICCDGRATYDPVHDVEKLRNVAVYLEVGQNDGDFVDEADRMHQALATLPHPNFVFHEIGGGNHFNYGAVYTDPQVWKWVLAQHRSPAMATTQPDHSQGSAIAR